MSWLWILLLSFTVISVILSLVLKGKNAKQAIKELLGTSKERATKFLNEFKRKTFHLIGLLVPAIYYYSLKYHFLTQFQGCLIVGTLAALSLSVDLLRLSSDKFNKLFQESPAGKIMRKKEINDINGSTYYLIGSVLTMIFFNPVIAIASLLFLDLGDLAAALVGISFGRIKIYKNKSLEGSIACFLVSLLVGISVFYPLHLYEYISLVGAITATLTELFLDHINDVSIVILDNLINISQNLTIPILSGVAMTLAQWRLGIEIPLL